MDIVERTSSTAFSRSRRRLRRAAATLVYYMYQLVIIICYRGMYARLTNCIYLGVRTRVFLRNLDYSLIEWAGGVCTYACVRVCVCVFAHEN